MPILGHLPQRRITCLGHPGGSFVIQPGVEPVVETECVLCRFTRQESEAKENYRKSIQWQKPGFHGEPMTEAEAFKGLRDED